MVVMASGAERVSIGWRVRCDAESTFWLENMLVKWVLLIRDSRKAEITLLMRAERRNLVPACKKMQNSCRCSVELLDPSDPYQTTRPTASFYWLRRALPGDQATLQVFGKHGPV